MRWLYLPLILSISLSDDHLREKLGKQRYDIMRNKESARPFSPEYLSIEKDGIYLCAACEQPLFDSKNKYNLGNGYLSFYEPISAKNVYYLEDWEMGFKRYQVLCRGCDSHLGHVFNDDPSRQPPKLRYSIHAICLKTKPAPPNY
jgi:peptide-methionine (R)-S-oxide reductase